MRARPLAVAVLAAAAFLAAGCGADAGSDVDSVSFPDRERQAVSAAITDFADATGKRDYEQICSDYLAAPLVKRLDDVKGTDTCPDQIELSLRDVDRSDLAVRSVRISGSDAVALVQPTGTGSVEKQARITLVKEGSRWKLSGIA